MEGDCLNLIVTNSPYVIWKKKSSMEDPQGINGKSVSKQHVSPKKKVIAFKVVIIFVATKSLEGFRKLHALLMIGSSG